MTIEEFIESAVLRMNSYYPQWRKKDHGRPICIPPALDVNTFFHAPRDGMVSSNSLCIYCYDYLIDDFEESILAKKHARNISGDDAETLFFNAMQSTTKLGGILFANCSSEILKGRIPGSKIDIFCKNNKFQIDFIYVHRTLGIFVIEVKHSFSALARPMRVNPNKIYDPVKDAIDQLTVKPNYVEKVRELFKVLTNNDCTIPVHAVICFPNVPILPLPQSEILHCDRTTLSSEQKLESLFLSVESLILSGVSSTGTRLVQCATAPQDYFAFDKFDNFVASLLCLRDELVWTHIGENALQTCLKIDRQEFFLNKVRNKTQDGKYDSNELPLFLNSTQKECYNSVDKRKILCGLPGTGKTILVMLHMEQAAKDRRKNVRIVVNLGISRLWKKYDGFIATLSSQNNYLSKGAEERPKFDKNVNLRSVKDKDHFFSDEVPGVFGEWKEFLAKRAILKDVFTIVAISGRSWADNIAVIAEEIRNNQMLKFFKTFQFQTVVRGTRNIIHYWADKHLSHLPDLPTQHWSPTKREFLPDKVRIGHNIIGAAVEEKKLATTDQILAEILKIVQEYLGETRAQHKNETNDGKFRPCHIAILTTNRFVVKFISEHLKRKPFIFRTECIAGSAKMKIKVDLSNKSLSQEYPVVIMVNYYGFEHAGEAMELTSASRAISRLIVLERDRMVIQREIDKILCTCPIGVKINFRIIRKVVEEACRSIKETSGKASAFEWDEHLANLRYNSIPHGVKNISDKLSNCEKFSDVLNVISNSKPLLNELVKVNAVPDTLFFSYSFLLNRLSTRDRESKLNSLDFKDGDVLNAVLSFYEAWENSMETFLHSRSAEDEKKADEETEVVSQTWKNIIRQIKKEEEKEEAQKWKEIIRIIMTIG